jgi:hypothetical protein
MPFWDRTRSAATDPWLGLTAAFGGGVAWAVGLGPWALAIAGGMYAAGAVVGGAMNDREEAQTKEPALPELRPGTEQAELVDNLRRYIGDLRTVREGPQPDALVDTSIEALVAAQNAFGTAVRVAAAVDGLDLALSRSGGPGGNQQVREAVQRMANRRGALLDKLRGTVDEVAEVYTELLELSAAVSSLDVGAGAGDEFARVNSSLDSLRTTLAELEAQAGG